MSASIKHIYDLLFSKQKVTISFPSRRAAENLRIALHKQHREAVAVELTSDSLCLDWNAKEFTGTFWLGQSRKKAANYFQIVSHEPVQEAVAEDPESGSSCQSEVSGGTSSDIDTSSQAVQSQGECQ
jgi:hypothetical protein